MLYPGFRFLIENMEPALNPEMIEKYLYKRLNKEDSFNCTVHRLPPRYKSQDTDGHKFLKLFTQFRMLFAQGLISWSTHTARTVKEDIFGDIISEGEPYILSSGIGYQKTILSRRSMDTLFNLLFQGRSLLPKAIAKLTEADYGTLVEGHKGTLVGHTLRVRAKVSS